jgi:hypothetical protein
MSGALINSIAFADRRKRAKIKLTTDSPTEWASPSPFDGSLRNVRSNETHRRMRTQTTDGNSPISFAREQIDAVARKISSYPVGLAYHQPFSGSTIRSLFRKRRSVRNPEADIP